MIHVKFIQGTQGEAQLSDVNINVYKEYEFKLPDKVKLSERDTQTK